MTQLPPNPWINESVSSSADRCGDPVNSADAVGPPPASAALSNSASISRDESLLPSREFAPDLSGVSAEERPLTDFTNDIIESFSDYAARECKDIISPPLNAGRIGLSAVRKALNIHPRDLDEDPPPLFLRKPRPAFLRALFELGDAR